MQKCETCGNEFNGRTSRVSRYCSSLCSNRAKTPRENPKITKTCPVCQRQFITGPRSQRVYCRVRCHNAANGIQPGDAITVICAHCGNAFVRPSSSSKIYCSRKCYNASHKKTLVCPSCGKEFETHSCVNHQYCSKACVYASRNGHKTITCETCGKEFVSQLWDTDRKFCDMKCMLIGMKKADTQPEITARTILDDLHIEYVHQYQVRPRFFVDFLIAGRVVLQVDGEYWHGHSKFEPLSKKQIAQRVKDFTQDRYCIACGYKVVRLWANDITPELIAQSISDAMIHE